MGESLTVVTYADSSVNLLNAFGIQEKETKIDENEKFQSEENVRQPK